MSYSRVSRAKWEGELAQEQKPFAGLSIFARYGATDWQIDVLVYELYGLTEEITVVEPLNH